MQAKAQVSSKYLDKEGAFALRPDLLLEIGSRSVIADTKYKIVYTDDKDPKKGISQSDLYQMLAYAVRFKIEEIILFFPNTIQGYQEQVSEVLIEDELAGGKQVKIRAFQLPILNERLLLQEKCKSLELVGMFEETKARLSRSIRSILLSSVFPSTSY